MAPTTIVQRNRNFSSNFPCIHSEDRSLNPFLPRSVSYLNVLSAIFDFDKRASMPDGKANYCGIPRKRRSFKPDQPSLSSPFLLNSLTPITSIASIVFWNRGADMIAEVLPTLITGRDDLSRFFPAIIYAGTHIASQIASNFYPPIYSALVVLGAGRFVVSKAADLIHGWFWRGIDTNNLL